MFTKEAVPAKLRQPLPELAAVCPVWSVHPELNDHPEAASSVPPASYTVPACWREMTARRLFLNAFLTCVITVPVSPDGTRMPRSLMPQQSVYIAPLPG